MNKKVLTLCASFLLAGGLTSSAFAENLTQAGNKISTGVYPEGQYFYIYTNEGAPANPSVNGKLDVNENTYWSHQSNRSTWWRLETVYATVNGQKQPLGYKLINALTNKPLTVVSGGVVYDTFKGNIDDLAFVDPNGAPLKYYNGTTNSVDAVAKIHYTAIAVPVQNLVVDQINKVKNGYFGLQFGYIDNNKYVNYESLEGANPFAGDLVAYGKDDEEVASIKDQVTGFASTVGNDFMIFNKTANKYVVLLKEKWSKNNTNHDPKEEGNGHKYALMTAKEIIEDQLQTDAKARKIASYVFAVNMPVVVDYSPLEVVAKNAFVDAEETLSKRADLEMYIANMGGVDYLTTTKAEGNDLLDGDTDYTDNELGVAIDPINTVVRFGGTDYADMSQFYGWAITIKGIKGTGVEGMTVRPDAENGTNVDANKWTKAEYVAFSRPEAQWIVTSQNGTVVLTNRETKETVRWDEAFDMLGNNKFALRHESGDTYVAGDFKFEIKKVAQLGGYTLDHYGDYKKDESEIGIGRTYKVTFNDAFGVPTYVGIDGTGNVLLTRDEAQAINFDVIKTQTTDTLLNNGTVDENAVEDVFYIINNYMKYNEKTKEWDYTANGDTLAYYRYELAYGDKYLKYNEAKKSFELVKENPVCVNPNESSLGADKVRIDYASSTLADNFIIKLKENDKLNIVKVINYEMEDVEAGKFYAVKSDGTYEQKDILKLGEEILSSDSDDKKKAKYMFTEGDNWVNYNEGEKLLANGEMVFFDFNNAEAQKQQNIYYWNANAQLSIDLNQVGTYRYFANPDTLEFYRTEYNDEFLYENTTVTDKGTINYLDMTYNRDEYNAAIYLDTAYIKDTKKPTYLLAVDVDIEPAHKYCPDHGLDADCKDEHLLTIPAYTTGRYLVSFTDSVAAHAAELKNPYLVDNKYTTLGFVDASHRVDSLYLLQNGDTVKNYTLTNAAARTSLNPVEFAFRIVNQLTQDFVIETTILNNAGAYVPAYVRWHNAMPVLTTDMEDAEVFNVRETSSNPTANEEITAEGNVIVAGTNGAVVVKGAEGKNVIVSTILGKVVANEVVSSDNATIAAPAGVVVVSVDGESFKVVVK